MLGYLGVSMERYWIAIAAAAVFSGLSVHLNQVDLVRSGLEIRSTSNLKKTSLFTSTTIAWPPVNSDWLGSQPR